MSLLGSRVLLESIVEIGMPATNEHAHAGEKIGRNEERSPCFVLTDVDALMRACHFQRAGVPSEHHMSQGDRIGASRERSAPSKRTLEKRAVRLDNTIDQRHTSTPKQRERQH